LNHRPLGYERSFLRNLKDLAGAKGTQRYQMEASGMLSRPRMDLDNACAVGCEHAAENTAVPEIVPVPWPTRGTARNKLLANALACDYPRSSRVGHGMVHNNSASSNAAKYVCLAHAARFDLEERGGLLSRLASAWLRNIRWRILRAWLILWTICDSLPGSCSNTAARQSVRQLSDSSVKRDFIMTSATKRLQPHHPVDGRMLLTVLARRNIIRVLRQETSFTR